MPHMQCALFKCLLSWIDLKESEKPCSLVLFTSIIPLPGHSPLLPSQGNLYHHQHNNDILLPWSETLKLISCCSKYSSFLSKRLHLGLSMTVFKLLPPGERVFIYHSPGCQSPDKYVLVIFLFSLYLSSQSQRKEVCVVTRWSDVSEEILPLLVILQLDSWMSVISILHS